MDGEDDEDTDGFLDEDIEDLFNMHPTNSSKYRKSTFDVRRQYTEWLPFYTLLLEVTDNIFLKVYDRNEGYHNKLRFLDAQRSLSYIGSDGLGRYDHPKCDGDSDNTERLQV